MKSKLILFSTMFLVAMSLGTALASPMDDGNTAYDARNYAQAQTAFQQATGQLTGPEQAKAYYKLGLTDHKLKQDAQAVQAYQQAQKIDPTLSFASSADKFQQNLARAQAASGVPTSAAPDAMPLTHSNAPRSAAPADGDPAAIALTAQNVYVDPPLQSSVDSVKLEAAAEQNSHTLVKIAVLDNLPRSFLIGLPQAQIQGSRQNPVILTDIYAKKLYDYLNLQSLHQGLIVVTKHGPGAGVTDVSDRLSQAQETQLAQKYVARIGAGDMTGGIVALSSDLSSTINAQERQGPDLILEIFLLVIVAVAVLIWFGTRQRKAQLTTLRGPLEQLRQNVLDNIQYIDNYTDVLPKNNADSDQVRAYRQAAEAKYEQAGKIMTKATDPSELGRAQMILDRAGADLTKARQYLDRATGGTANIPGDSALRPAPLPASQDQVDAVPQQQRGVSFFSSQPAPVNGLVPVTLTIDGVQRQVMATPEEAAEIKRGQIPPVRAFNVNGQYVPWYAYQSYDPYRDYWGYQNTGWGGGGFGSGVATGFIGAELLDTLFRPNYYGNYYSPYGYAPGFDSWGGWNSYGGGGYGQGYDQGFLAGEERGNPNDYAFQDQYTQPPTDAAGGASFLGGGYDASDYGRGGGGSFGGDRS